MPDQIEPKALHDAHSYCCPKSIIEWGTNLIPDWISIYQYLGIMFLMALESACMPVPSEIVMPFAGFLVAQGDSGTSLLGVTIAGSLGCRIGSIAACFFGFHAGRPLILRYGKYILIREKHLVAAKEWFENWGDKATFKARLLPVIRTVMSLPAGTAKMNLACCINLGHPP
ncbi:MAG: DedA family protein [Thermoplasmatota archaeon]|nr:DedA family protein [Candidatus Thermoplasmatota archaeon]MBU1914906.1 DedA family protein [Candidatus Thermoplasmatota archaeon]